MKPVVYLAITKKISPSCILISYNLNSITAAVGAIKVRMHDVVRMQNAKTARFISSFLIKYTFGNGADLNYYVWQFGEHGGSDGRVTALRAGMSRVRLEFFIDIILSPALWPWGRLIL